MFDHFRLLPFQSVHSREIVSWATSAEEAHQWGGLGIRWPLDTSIFPVWHSDPDVQPYVLYKKEELLGYGEVWADKVEQEVELARILIKPDKRGQGIGQRLVALLLERAVLTGYENAFLRVFPENSRAIACYLHAGFSPVTAEEQQRYNQGQPLEYLWLRHELRLCGKP